MLYNITSTAYMWPYKELKINGPCKFVPRRRVHLLETNVIVAGLSFNFNFAAPKRESWLNENRRKNISNEIYQCHSIFNVL